MVDGEVRIERAIFAGGRFWYMEAVFSEVAGVLEVVSGYTGGWKHNPTYEEVATGETGHFEAVMVTYDPSMVSYDELLEVFWSHIDPVDPDGQFTDRGSQYRTAIFYLNEEQRVSATASKKKLEASYHIQGPVATLILKALKFYKAEIAHQSYYKKNPDAYEKYCVASGRKRFFNNV